MTETNPSPSIPELLAYRWTKAQPLLTAYVGSLVADFSIAEDIVQEVAVAVARQFDVVQAQRPFMPWVFGIARNQMKMHLREKYRRVVVFNSEALDQVEAAYLGVEQEAGERREALRFCTEKLNHKARQLVECRYASGLGPAEIADRVGTTPNTVSVALARIRRHLADCILRYLSREKRA